MAAITKSRAAGDDYLSLVKRFPLAPIRSHRDYKSAVRMIDELSVIDEDKLNRGQSDYLLVLTDQVERYEAARHAVDLSHLSGIDSLKFLLNENGMTGSDLGRLLGNRQLGASILRDERKLSKDNIRRLCERFKVSADVFLS